MVQVIPRNNEWKEAIGQSISNVWEPHKQAHDEIALQKSLQNLKPNASARDILDAITETKTYSPKAKQNALENYLGAEKLDQTVRQAEAKGKELADYKRMEQDLSIAKERKRSEEKEREQGINEKKNEIELAKYNFNKQEKELKKTELQDKEDKKIAEKEKDKQEKQEYKESLINTFVDLPEATKEILKGGPLNIVESLYKKQITPKDEKLSPAEVQYSKDLAKEYFQIGKDLPELQGDLEKLDDIEKLVDSGSFIGGWFGSGKAKELNAKTLPFIKYMTKILAPAGPIIKAKMDLAKDTIHINATDPIWQQKGKIRALRYMLEASASRMEKRQQYILDSNFRFPKESMKEFDEETANELDKIIKMPFRGATAKDLPEEMPPPEEEKGKYIDAPDGNTYYSNGEKWTIYNGK